MNPFSPLSSIAPCFGIGNALAYVIFIIEFTYHIHNRNHVIEILLWIHDEYNLSYTWCCMFTLRAFLFWVLIHIIAYIYVFFKRIPHRVVSSNFLSFTCPGCVMSPCRCYIGTEFLGPKLFNYALKLNNLIVQHILKWDKKCISLLAFNTWKEVYVA